MTTELDWDAPVGPQSAPQKTEQEPESFETARPVVLKPADQPAPGRSRANRQVSQAPLTDDSSSIELQVLGACLVDGSDVFSRATERGIRPSSFSRPAHRALWSAFAELGTDIGILIPTLQGRNGESPAAIQAIIEASSAVPTTTRADHFIDLLTDRDRRQSIERLGVEITERARKGEDTGELLSDLQERVGVLASPGRQITLSTLEQRRVRASTPPPEPVTRLFLSGKPIATPGNLVTLISRAKTGKTATIGAAVAAIIAAHHDRSGLDTLKFTAPHTSDAVVLIDTEQSPFDAYTCYQRAMKRAAQEADPAWLHHYALVGYSAAQLRDSLPLLLSHARAKTGGVFMLILDGVADFVDSVNDEAECNNYIATLRSLSVEFNCPVLCVIHSNEAVKAGDDGRGHLGKQLTRKAESNLLLKKTGEVTTITSEKQRKAPITDSDKVAFQWSDERQMHVLTELTVPENRGGRPPKYKFEEMIPAFSDGGGKPMTRSALWKFAEDRTGVKDTAFKDLLYQAVKDGLVIQTGTKAGYLYSLPGAIRST